MHNTDDRSVKEYKKLLKTDIEEIKNYLSNFVFSRDSKEPVKSLTSIKENILRELYAANILNNNLGDITKISSKDIKEKVDLITYSFPCQDLSICGKGKGMTENSNTRSSLLWNIYRILKELNIEKRKPTFLLLENVTAIDNKKNKKDLNSFKDKLQELGYSSYDFKLDASEFGIPQKRKRFYMISILNGGNKEFQISRRELNFKLKHFLDFENMNPTNRESEYINSIKKQIKTKNISKENILKQKYTKLAVYPTFQQANIVTGIESDTIPTVTFSGENSRQRVLGYASNQFTVRELGAKENLFLMGFDKQDYANLRKEDILKDNIIKSLAGNSIVVNVLEEIFEMMFELKN